MHYNGEIQWKSAYMLEKTEGAINDVQSIYTENIGHKTQNDHILKKSTTQKPMKMSNKDSNKKKRR
jgi:hypothetical protein